MKLKPPQKYIVERRNNTMNDDNNDNQSVYSYAQTGKYNSYFQDNLNQFENDLGDLPLTQGVRNSEFGFHQIPESKAFVKVNDYHQKFDRQDVDQKDIINFKQAPDQILNVGGFQNEVQLDI